MSSVAASESAASMDDWISLGSAPISAAEPAGRSARADTIFEALSSEVAKHESLTAGDVDWDSVVELGAQILGQQSKDLLVAVYFCRGTFSTHGFPGLVRGLIVLDELVMHFWQGMEPPIKRMRGRAAAFAWLVEKLSEAIRQNPPGPDQRADADQCLSLLGQIDLRLQGGGLEVDFSALRKALKHEAPIQSDAIGIQPVEPKAAQGEVASEAVVGGQTPAVVAEPPAVAPVATGQTPQKVDPELRRLARRCMDEMQKLAGVWLERDLRDIRAYRFARLAAWSTVDKAPRSDNGLVDLPPPTRNRLNSVLSLYQQKRFTEFVVEAEMINSRHIFWLDGHRLVAAALNGMGEQFEPAARAVSAEVLAFVERIPEVVTLSFSDGTAFASPSTQAWIEQERNAHSPAPEGFSRGGESGVAEQWGKIAGQAAELADNGDFESVAGLFAARLQEARNHRVRFHWRLTEAGFYYRYGRDPVVLGIVEGLMRDVDRFELLEWEPDLVLSLAELAVRCSDRSGKTQRSPQLDAVARRAFELLCRLDPSSALKLR